MHSTTTLMAPSVTMSRRSTAALLVASLCCGPPGAIAAVLSIYHPFPRASGARVGRAGRIVWWSTMVGGLVATVVLGSTIVWSTRQQDGGPALGAFVYGLVFGLLPGGLVGACSGWLMTVALRMRDQRAT